MATIIEMKEGKLGKGVYMYRNYKDAIRKYRNKSLYKRTFR